MSENWNPCYQSVTCRTCCNEFVCTPTNDYYGGTNATTGQCFICILRADHIEPIKPTSRFRKFLRLFGIGLSVAVLATGCSVGKSAHTLNKKLTGCATGAHKEPDAINPHFDHCVIDTVKPASAVGNLKDVLRGLVKVAGTRDCAAIDTRQNVLHFQRGNVGHTVRYTDHGTIDAHGKVNDPIERALMADMVSELHGLQSDYQHVGYRVILTCGPIN